MNHKTIGVDVAKTYFSIVCLHQHKNGNVADIDVFAIALFAGARQELQQFT